jgi:hypothetical protein
MGSRRDDDLLGPFLALVSKRWKVASDREKIGFLLIIGVFCSVIGGGALLARFGGGHSLVYVLKRPGSVELFWMFVAGVGMLIGAAAIVWKRPVQVDPDRPESLKEPADGPSDCTACGAWNPPGSQHCGECGAALKSAEA